MGAYFGGVVYNILGPALMELETYRMITSAVILFFFTLFFDTWRPSQKQRG